MVPKKKANKHNKIKNAKGATINETVLPRFLFPPVSSLSLNLKNKPVIRKIRAGIVKIHPLQDVMLMPSKITRKIKIADTEIKIPETIVVPIETPLLFILLSYFKII